MNHSHNKYYRHKKKNAITIKLYYNTKNSLLSIYNNNYMKGILFSLTPLKKENDRITRTSHAEATASSEAESCCLKASSHCVGSNFEKSVQQDEIYQQVKSQDWKEKKKALGGHNF